MWVDVRRLRLWKLAVWCYRFSLPLWMWSLRLKWLRYKIKLVWITETVLRGQLLCPFRLWVSKIQMFIMLRHWEFGTLSSEHKLAYPNIPSSFGHCYFDSRNLTFFFTSNEIQLLIQIYFLSSYNVPSIGDITVYRTQFLSSRNLYSRREFRKKLNQWTNYLQVRISIMKEINNGWARY